MHRFLPGLDRRRWRHRTGGQPRNMQFSLMDAILEVVLARTLISKTIGRSACSAIAQAKNWAAQIARGQKNKAAATPNDDKKCPDDRAQYPIAHLKSRRRNDAPADATRSERVPHVRLECEPEVLLQKQRQQSMPYPYMEYIGEASWQSRCGGCWAFAVSPSWHLPSRNPRRHSRRCSVSTTAPR